MFRESAFMIQETVKKNSLFLPLLFVFFQVILFFHFIWFRSSVQLLFCWITFYFLFISQWNSFHFDFQRDKFPSIYQHICNKSKFYMHCTINTHCTMHMHMHHWKWLKPKPKIVKFHQLHILMKSRRQPTNQQTSKQNEKKKNQINK